MAWVYDYFIPYYDIAYEVGQLRIQILDFIMNLSPSYFVLLMVMATIGFIIYLFKFMKYTVEEAQYV